MRKNRSTAPQTDCSILAVDDDKIMTLSLQSYFQSAGYRVDVENDPVRAVERVRTGSYDILLLDFLMSPISGDQMVEQIRKFNNDLFIILLTGHKSMAPPIKTIRQLDIQGYYEKSDRFDQLELLVESCVKSIRQIRTIRSYQNGLDQILSVIPSIYQSDSTTLLVGIVLDTLKKLTGSDHGLFAISDQLLHHYDSVGMLCGDYQVSVSGDCARLFRLEALDEEYAALQAAADPTRALVPFTDRSGVLIGYLGVCWHSPATQQQRVLLDLYATQLAAAIANIHLYKALTRKNEALSQANRKLTESHTEAIRLLRLTVDARDIYTRGHSDRVSYYAHRIARAMGKPEDYCELVRVAGLFHDIGKLGISDDVLLKPSRLSQDEYQLIKEHPGKGADMLASTTAFQDIAPVIRAHHERWDGKGYPDGLAGTHIPEAARMIAIADSFDAMTSNRQYRGALPLEHAKEELRTGSGTQFDPDMVPVFLAILENYTALEQELAWTHSGCAEEGSL